MLRSHVTVPPERNADGPKTPPDGARNVRPVNIGRCRPATGDVEFIERQPDEVAIVPDEMLTSRGSRGGHSVPGRHESPRTQLGRSHARIAPRMSAVALVSATDGLIIDALGGPGDPDPDAMIATLTELFAPGAA